MTLVLNPDQREQIKAKLRIIRKRRLIKRFTGKDGLLEFVKYFWHVLEPQTPFVDGWPLWAICEHLQAVSDGRITRLLINVPPGFMKPCDCDTQVLTTLGWKRHGDLAIGDYVYGPDGLPKRILARTPNKKEECYRISFDDGAEAVATADHYWEVERDTPNQNEQKRGGWKRLKKVVKTKELWTHGPCPSRTSPDRIALCRPIQGKDAVLPIDPYLFGVWLGDGQSSQGILYCGNEDLEHFSQFGKVVVGTQTANRISVECLTTRLRLLGVLNNKRIPESYLYGSAEQRLALLQGLMDTDGQSSPEGWCRFTTGNADLAKSFMILACSLGLKPTLSDPFYSKEESAVKKGPYWRIRFTPPCGMTIFRLERKQSRLPTEKIRKGINHRFVRSVEPVGERLVNCIEVEGGLYLITDRFVTTHNSLLTNVFFPAWEWALGGAHHRYVTFSYSSSLTERDNRRFGALITCPEYQELFGDKFQVAKLGDKMVSNTATGWKLASSVGGVGTGERGSRVLLDDPHNVKEAESEIIRGETVRWFRESMSNRLNDMERDAIIVIMQRLHGDDVSGVILEKGMAYQHLMVPMFYDYDRQTDDNYEPITTSIGWYDPRYDEFDPENPEELLAWPERFPQHVWDAIQVDIGPYAVAGQYMQSPTPRGGGIFKRDWWQLWESPDGKFPAFDYLIASLDSAFTEKERNDPSALTIWGVFRDKEEKNRVMLVHAWRKHLQFSGPRSDPMVGEGRNDYIQRTQKDWGLVEWVKYSCERFKVDNLLIEAKASGMSAAQELQNRYGRLSFGIDLCQVKGSKEARALAAQPTFSQLLVYAPARDWADMVIEEMESFPKHKYKDLTDSSTQAIRYLRDNDLLIDDYEAEARENELITHHGKKQSLSFF